MGRFAAAFCLVAAAGVLLVSAGNPNRVRRRQAAPAGRRAPGMPGHAAGFVNASTQSLTLAPNTSLSITGNWSAAGWFNLASHGNYRHVLTKQVGDNPSQVEWAIQTDPSPQLDWVTSNGTTFRTFSNNTALSLNTWYFFYAEFNAGAGGTMTLRVNNAVNSIAAGAAPQQQNYTVGIGYYGGTTPAVAMDGSIDAVGIWGRVLTTAEQNEIYNNGSGIRLSQTPSLWNGMLAGYELDEATGTAIWTDWFAGNNLTNTNGVTSVTGVT